MTKCRHLVISEEAYRVTGGVSESVPGYLCLWAVDAFAIAPKWFEKLNGGGAFISDPKTECQGCPCHSPQSPLPEKDKG